MKIKRKPTKIKKPVLLNTKKQTKKFLTYNNQQQADVSINIIRISLKGKDFKKK
jgi:hypothetical protein